MIKQQLEPVVKRKFWMEVYIAAVRAGDPNGAKAHADNALMAMRDRFEIIEVPRLPRSAEKDKSGEKS
jgi:hypothetical protein